LVRDSCRINREGLYWGEKSGEYRQLEYASSHWTRGGTQEKKRYPQWGEIQAPDNMLVKKKGGRNFLIPKSFHLFLGKKKIHVSADAIPEGGGRKKKRTVQGRIGGGGSPKKNSCGGRSFTERGNRPHWSVHPRCLRREI